MRYVLVLAIVLAASTPAAADSCPPTVTLDGDPALVAMLRRELAGRGIALGGACPAHAVHVERRGDALVISIAQDSRTVRAVQVAAAVIESFVREDVGLPLLAVRSPPAPAPAASDSLAPQLAERHAPQGVHAFAGLESSVASDGTKWIGVQIGACKMLGPLCVGGRLRGGAVKPHDNLWEITQRKSAELLFSVDVPFALGRFLVVPGVAAGFGDVTTKDAPDSASRSSNFRAQAHAAFSIPVTTKLAVDLTVVGTLVQQVEREGGYMDTVPEEPFGFLRFGVAMRYGRR